ncbi:AAA domain-containing protein [Nocardiopsis sediminis]|uniref:AAA domain-containing protein n=1 Tax=Nocardiopsis sediminis TaxID=1778267 RepID=A0ABV8FHB9_9ACTN
MDTQGTPTPRPQWLTDATEAVRIWWRAEGGGTDRKHRGDVKVGQVLPAPDRDPGWFAVIAAETKFDETDLEAAYLAPAEGSDEIRYNLREAVNDEGRYLVRVAPHAPGEGLYLWKQGRPAGQLVKSLLDALEQMDGSGVVSAFGRGRPDPPPRNAPGRAATGLNEGQRQAFTACASPGLSMIWGPPGTGKTEVITRAIQHAQDAGKSVLLVSGTNIAVDNALERAIRRLKPDPGAMIRVGTPHLAAVADNEAVSLTALKRVRQQAKEDELRALEAEIARVRLPVAEYEEAQARLGGFDQNAYFAARDRIDASARAVDLQGQQSRQAHDAEGARQALQRATERKDAAEQAWGSLSAAAGRWNRVDALRTQISDLRARRDAALLRVHDAQHGLAAAQAEAARIAGSGLITRLRSGAQRRAAEEAVARAEQLLIGANRELGDLDGVLAREIPRLSTEIGRLEEENATAPRSAVVNAWREKEAAEEAVGSARRGFDTAARTLDRLEGEVARALARPGATEDDRALVAKADTDGLPALFAELKPLAERAEQAEKNSKGLERRREKAERELAELGRNAERVIIGQAGVVASTLAMMRMKPAVAGRSYDYVIVDECAASSVPEVVHAVSRATVGAVLLGDFMQNAPIAPSRGFGSSDSRVATWLAPRDCFSFFSVATPEQANREPACVVLTEQHRFGGELTRLANATAYGGLLRAAPGNAPSQIVFVDVDGLGESLAAVHKNPEGGGGKWWSIGGVVSRALAEQQLSTGTANTVGIVTPYRVQAALTQGILDDAGGSAKIEVGTSHSFQGREFETVVFDMVENGGGWVAEGELGSNSYKLAGLKLFNVAITRTRHHLFLVGDGTAVERATNGPLAAVRAGIDRGDITVMRVRDVIGVPEPDTLDGAARDLWDALSQYVRYTGLYDEGGVPDMLLEHIARARRSIWVWAPWVSERAAEFLPALEEAMRRGVDVRVVTLPKWELERKPGKMSACHDDLVRRVGRVVFMSDQHQKLVVIDGQTTFIGSMNVLSHKRDRGRREIMTIVESAAYAQHVLRFERVDQLRMPPLCGKCGNRMRVVKLTQPKKDHGLRWQCRSGSGSADLCSERKFPPLPKARNQKA